MTTREIEKHLGGIATALTDGDTLAAKWGVLGLLVRLRVEHAEEDAYHDSLEPDSYPVNAEAA